MPDAIADPASLDRFHDIVAPSPVSLWWPPAPGWWIVLGIILAAVVWLLFRRWSSWRARAYRRRALEELKEMKNIRQLPELLKRTALAAYPRETVASLTGDKWLAFLNEKAPVPWFQGDTGETLKTLQYSPYTFRGQQKKDELMLAVERWIRKHSATEAQRDRKRRERSA